MNSAGLWQMQSISSFPTGNKNKKIQGEIKMDNIILIGMPGCGKSTVGVVLAKAMGYRFGTLDELTGGGGFAA